MSKGGEMERRACEALGPLVNIRTRHTLEAGFGDGPCPRCGAVAGDDCGVQAEFWARWNAKNEAASDQAGLRAVG